MQAFIAFVALKFGSYGNNPYICSIAQLAFRGERAILLYEKDVFQKQTPTPFLCCKLT